MQEQETQQPETKLSDAPYTRDVMDKLRAHELIDANIGALKEDFNITYKDVLEQTLPLSEDHASKIKSDLFMAFCQGAVIATDMTSKFRKNFNLPKAVMESMSEKKIILPDSGIKTNGNKIIT